MLLTSKQCNESPHEVDVTAIPMYWLVGSDRLRMLMERTGTGASISIRDLAKACGASKSTIGALLTGEQASVPAEVAYRIAETIGCDVLILFAPVGRGSAADEAGRAGIRAVSA